MHDPDTVAFDIKRPWPTRARIGTWRWYWPTWVTIWHHDPELRGDDDSCGWSRPHLTQAQIDDLNFYAGCEARDPWLLRDRSKYPLSVADAELKLDAAIRLVGQRLGYPVQLHEAQAWASRLLHNPIDNVRGSLCHLPGWHTNRSDEDEDERRARALNLFCILGRFILLKRRPWYRHPRWHVWHWRIQVHPLQQFKRWAFSRCAGCGGRFVFGYSPTSGNWYGTGPKWFRSETGVYHSKCFPSKPTGDAKVGQEIRTGGQ